MMHVLELFLECEQAVNSKVFNYMQQMLLTVFTLRTHLFLCINPFTQVCETPTLQSPAHLLKCEECDTYGRWKMYVR